MFMKICEMTPQNNSFHSCQQDTLYTKFVLSLELNITLTWNMQGRLKLINETWGHQKNLTLKSSQVIRVASRLKMVAFKHYWPQKNVTKNEEEKKKTVFFWWISQVNNEFPCVLFKRASSSAKKKWLKVCKII